MQIIQSDTELTVILGKITQETLEKITKEVLEIFQKEYLLKFAYIKNPKEYKRTMEFYEAWNWTEIKEELGKISTELWYDSTKIKTRVPENFIHGSIYSSPNDIAETLPDILEGHQSSLWLSVPRTIKFWDWFIGAMLQGGRMEQIVSKHFTSAGFIKS